MFNHKNITRWHWPCYKHHASYLARKKRKKYIYRWFRRENYSFLWKQNAHRYFSFLHQQKCHRKKRTANLSIAFPVSNHLARFMFVSSSCSLPVQWMLSMKPQHQKRKTNKIKIIWETKHKTKKHHKNDLNVSIVVDWYKQTT